MQVGCSGQGRTFQPVLLQESELALISGHERSKNREHGERSDPTARAMSESREGERRKRNRRERERGVKEREEGKECRKSERQTGRERQSVRNRLLQTRAWFLLSL